MAAPAKRPNILVILTDQQTGSAMSAAGSPYMRTPNMDRIAREGTRFANCWCSSPVCSPARSSLITGLWPSASGVVYNGDSIKPGVQTIGDICREAGYDTAWAGKWHLPVSYPGVRGASDAHGFHFLPFSVPQARMAYGEFTDDPIAGAAAAYLRQKREQPFALFVSMHNPHDICYWVMNKLPPEHPMRTAAESVAERDLPPLPANFQRMVDEPEFIQRCRVREYYGEENTFTKGWDETHWRRYLYAYHRLVERVDKNVGVVLDALEQSGQGDNTIVVFSSDHGEGSAAHQWVVKLMLWQETLSIPMIMRWRGTIPQGRVDSTSLVSGADLTPTLCDFAGLPAPPGVQGVSLKTPPKRDSIYAQLDPDTKDHATQGRAVRTRDYKYMSFSGGGRNELLFDLKHDPGETRDLSRSRSHAKILAEHRRLLAQWTART
jgi:arylsulfatase A-like enzyme